MRVPGADAFTAAAAGGGTAGGMTGGTAGVFTTDVNAVDLAAPPAVRLMVAGVRLLAAAAAAACCASDDVSADDSVIGLACGFCTVVVFCSGDFAYNSAP